MSDRVDPIARIRLSRSLPRLLGFPLIGLAAGATAIAAGLLVVSGIVGVAIAGLGGVVVLGSLVAAIVLLSIRRSEERRVGKECRSRWALDEDGAEAGDRWG